MLGPLFAFFYVAKVPVKMTDSGALEVLRVDPKTGQEFVAKKTISDENGERHRIEYSPKGIKLRERRYNYPRGPGNPVKVYDSRPDLPEDFDVAEGAA